MAGSPRALTVCSGASATPYHEVPPLARRVVMQSEGMEVGGALWLQVLAELLVPLVSELARTVSFQVRPPSPSPPLQFPRFTLLHLTRPSVTHLPCHAPADSCVGLLMRADMWRGGAGSLCGAAGGAGSQDPVPCVLAAK